MKEHEISVEDIILAPDPIDSAGSEPDQTDLTAPESFGKASRKETFEVDELHYERGKHAGISDERR